MPSTENTVLNILYEYNPWWKSLPFTVPQYRTSLCQQLIQEKDSCENELIYGPRQVGKTVLMKQMIKHLLEEYRVPPHNILYLSMDHVFFSSFCDKPIQDAMDTFLKYVLPPDSKQAYIFLDEVESVHEWYDQIRPYHRLQTKVKFYISGHSVSGIEGHSSSTLIGESKHRRMFQWSFKEYLLYHQTHKNYDAVIETFKFNYSDKQDHMKFYEALVKYHDDVLMHIPSLEECLKEYIIKGGYPDLFGIDPDAARDILMDRLMLTLYKDIMRPYAVRNIAGLENTVFICAMQSGHITDYHSFAKAIEIKYDTLMNYIDHLLDIYMLSESLSYSKRDSTSVKGKKLYFRDHPTRNMLIGLLNTRLFEYTEEVNRTVETIVQDHACRNEEPPFDKLKSYYWKGKKEVNPILDFSHTMIPLDVKYRKDMDDTLGLREYIKKSGSPYGIVVTEDTLELGDNVVFMPLAMFLLIC